MLEPCKLVTKDLLGWFRDTLKDFQKFWFFRVIFCQNFGLRAHRKWKNQNISLKDDRRFIWKLFYQIAGKKITSLKKKSCLYHVRERRYFYFSIFPLIGRKHFGGGLPEKNRNFSKSFKISLNHPKRSFVTNLLGSSVKTAFFIAILPPPDLKFPAPLLDYTRKKGYILPRH